MKNALVAILLITPLFGLVGTMIVNNKMSFFSDALGHSALTGIALLFAMIRINPAPLCLLDEIDAPLDEANVVRFGNYVRKIPDSQFLIITHRKPTMAICPVLFGVTMEEKGVSKLVSVKIEEKE